MRTNESTAEHAIDWEYVDYYVETAELLEKSDKRHAERMAKQPVRTARLHSKCEVSVSDESFEL